MNECISTRSVFQFQTKDESIMNYCRELWESENKTFDVVFVAKDAREVHAHRLILSVSCEFFRELFESTFLENDDMIRIVVPHYDYETINILIRFFYTGEISIEPWLLQEFIDFCLEFNCETIPDVDELIKNHKIELDDVPVSDQLIQEWYTQNSNNTRINITRLEVPLKVEFDIDEYFEVNQNVETIYLNENDQPQNIEDFPILKNKDYEGLINEFAMGVKEEFIDDDEIEMEGTDNEVVDGDCEKAERIAYRTIDGEGTNPVYDEKLKLACGDVMNNGISFLTASRKYGITRSVIHRHVQRLRGKMGLLSPKQNFNIPGTSSKSVSLKPSSSSTNEMSWWDATNPSWNTDPTPIFKHSKKSKNKVQYKVEGTKGRNPEFAENLRRAVEDVMKNGISFWTAHKKYGITRSVIHRHVQRIRDNEEEARPHKKKIHKKITPLATVTTAGLPPILPVNMMQLREEQNKYKERLQKAITACRNEDTSIKKASKLYDVPMDAIERNLQGYKKN
ncbi:unnamed protein product [Diamesa tonsa]